MRTIPSQRGDVARLRTSQLGSQQLRECLTNARCRAVEIGTWFMSSRVEKTFASPDTDEVHLSTLHHLVRTIDGFRRYVQAEPWAHSAVANTRRSPPRPLARAREGFLRGMKLSAAIPGAAPPAVRVPAPLAPAAASPRVTSLRASWGPEGPRQAGGKRAYRAQFLTAHSGALRKCLRAYRQAKIDTSSTGRCRRSRPAPTFSGVYQG